MLTAMRGAIGGVATFAIVTVAGMGVIAGLTVAGVEIHAAISKPVGDAGVRSDTNGSKNQEADSAIFNQLKMQITGYQFQIQQDVAAAETTAAQLVSGSCVQAVNQYNADAQVDNMGPNLPTGYPTSYALGVCDVPN